jgi:hypothetical protein
VNVKQEKHTHFIKFHFEFKIGRLVDINQYPINSYNPYHFQTTQRNKMLRLLFCQFFKEKQRH